MSDQSKHLLNEAQVRQFMKLAKLEPLAAGFVEGLKEVRTGIDPTPNLQSSRRGHGRGRDGTSRLEEEEASPEGLEDYAAGDLERGHPDEAEADELEAADELGAEDAAPEERMVSIDDFLSALESTLETVLGDEVEIDSDDLGDEEEELEVDAELAPGGEEVDVDVEEPLEEDKAYTAKKEKPGEDKRKGAEKRGAEGTLAKTKGHGKGDYVNEEQGADDREDEHLGAEDGKESDKKQSLKDRRKEMRGDRRAAGEAGDPVPTQESTEATAELVEQITKRVAARILKSALSKK